MNKKEIRNLKDQDRYKTNKESREKQKYRILKSTAKRFLTTAIKDKDKQEFKEYLKNL